MKYSKHRSHKHKNIFVFFVGLLLALAICQNSTFRAFWLNLGNYGYLGAFVAGMLLISTFSIATGIVVLVTLAQRVSPITLGVFALFGAVIGDVLIFKFIKDDVEEEIEPIYKQFAGKHLTKLLHTRYFSWTLPVVGAFILATPLPDELAISLMGISKMTIAEFFIISLLSHATGIFLIISASLVF